VELHPDLRSALQAQLAAWRALLDAGARHVGWKIGGAIGEVDAFTGGAPVVGYLTTSTILADGATHRASGGALHAETELLIEDDRLGVALELVDTTRRGGMHEIVAANVFHRAAALGETLHATPGTARLWIDDELRATAPVDTDVDAVRARVHEVLAAVGERLRPGDRVLAGSLIHVPVAPGQHVVAEIEGLGRVAVSLRR
jgi:2-keto-4-pentenoate hydratase